MMSYESALLDKVVYLTETSTVEDFPKYMQAALAASGHIDIDPYDSDLEIAPTGQMSSLTESVSSSSGAGLGDEAALQSGMSYMADMSLWSMPEKRILTSRKIALGIGWQRAGAAAKPSKVQGAQNIEVSDPKHRVGHVINAIYEKLYKTKHKGPKKDGAFFEWLNTLTFFEVFKFLMAEFGIAERLARNEALAFLKGVTYLDKASRPNLRAKVAKSGLLQHQGAPLDTASMSTVFSGRGWGIWVMSPKKRFYTNSHQRGIFHHSSFMSGGKVICGGEWKVSKGRIEYITGKTGHYMSDLEALAATLKELVLGGADLSRTQVGMYGAQGSGTLVPAFDVLTDPSVRTGMQAFGSKPFLKVEPNVRQRPRMQIGGARS